MNELASRTLAQIVTGNHRTAAVFEKYHLDFCCKGKRSLQQACTEQNISVEDLLKELEGISSANQPAFPFDRLSLSQLCEHIVSTHHHYVKNELPQLLAYAEKVASKHGQRHPELYKIFEAVAAVKEEMTLHMQKEEVILFPRIKELEKFAGHEHGQANLSVTYLQAPITMMEHEHDHAGSLLAEIRGLSDNYTAPQDACTTYKLLFAALQAFEMDLHQHVHLENNILFPRSVKLAEELNKSDLN
ncbi:MAG: iron-sulfur cluster repair di-iron protein [Chitinophagaceae bacterium]|nr:iron-sulfur cluster repair di-iron protein [Chitinophagaceae bacterium]